MISCLKKEATDMKRLYLCFTMILLLFVVCIPACGADFRTGCHVQVVNCQEYITLRESPSTSADELTKIPLHFYAAYLSDAENGFARVSFQGTEGYVLKDYLKVVGDFSGKAVTLTSDERYTINLFLSNFTEQLFAGRSGFFDVDAATDAEMIQFAVNYICSNKKEWIDEAENEDAVMTAPWNGSRARVSDTRVQDVTERYFGKTPADLWDSIYDHRDGYYYWDYTNDLFSPFGFACLYDVQKFDEEFYSVWFKSIGNGVRWSNDNCYMTLEQAEDSFDERTINGNGYALIRTDGSGNLEDKSSWILQRYVWNHK